MEETSKKIITVSFLIAAGLAALIVRVLLETAAGAVGFMAKYYALDLVQHGIPVGVGLLTFILLQFNSKVVAWADEVVLEVSKVVWPSQRDTIAGAITACAMLLLAGVVLGLFDWASTTIVGILIK